MANYKIEQLDYNFRVMHVIRDESLDIKGQSYNNALTVHNSGYKELEFTLPYYILDDNVQKVNPLVSYIYNESIIKYTESNESEYFVIIAPTKAHSSDSLDVTIKCIPFYVKRLSTLGINSTVGGEDVEPRTVGEWLSMVLANTEWSVGNVELLQEQITVTDDDGNLRDITQTKRRTVNFSSSHCYNMIMELCSTFQCYAVFNQTITDGIMRGTIDIVSNRYVDSGIVFQYAKNLENIEVNYNSDEIVTKLYAVGGENPDTGLVNIASVNPTMEPYIIDMSYFIDAGLFTEDDQAELDAYMDQLTQINKSLANVVKRNTTALLEKSKVEPDRVAYKHTIDDLKTRIKNNQKKLKNYSSTSDEYEEIQAEIDAQNEKLEKYQALYNEVNVQYLALVGLISEYSTMIKSTTTSKNAIYKDMNIRFGKFLREGLFIDEKYMYPEQLYSDALEVSKRSSYPQITYNLSVTLLDDFTGYTIEDVRAGEIVHITDSTIGIENKEAIIKSIKYILDDRSSSEIEITNVVNKFDDLFSKIIRATTVINGKITMLERSIGAFNGDGTIKEEIVGAIVEDTQFNYKLSSNGSVYTTEEGLFVTDIQLYNGSWLPDYSKGLKVVGKGIFSKGAGDEWDVLITADGKLNISKAEIGVLDVDKIIIQNGEDPAFSWNKYGILAYDTTDGTINDFDSYTKFFKDGIQVYRLGKKRLSLGKLSTGIYGLALYDNSDNTVMQTDTDGDLWLSKYMSVGGTSPAWNKAGISGEVSVNPDNDVRFWAGATYANRGAAPFRVTDDGKIYASGGDIAGWAISTDNLTSGNVGLSSSGSQPTDIRIYAGNTNKGNAPFQVWDDGSILASNASISGVLKAVTFKYDEFTVNAGSLLVIEADVLRAECSVVQGTGLTTISCERTDLFQVGDVVRMKSGNTRPVGGGSLYLADSWLKIESKLASGYEYIATWLYGSYGYKYPVKSPIVNYGRPGSGHILLHTAADGTDRTYIDIVENNTVSPYTITAPWLGYSTASVVLNSFINNGSFIDGTTGWTTLNSSHSVTDRILTNTCDGSAASGLEFQNTSLAINTSHKYYVRFYARVTNASASSLNVYFDGTTAGSDKTVFTQASPVNGTWYTMSAINTPPSDATGNLKVIIRHSYADATTANGKSMQVSGFTGVMCIDLTECFGAGNEPTSPVEVDNIVTKFGGFWSGNKTLDIGLRRRIRLGDLRDITDTDIQETALSGWGAYLDNVYLKGIIAGAKLRIDSKLGTLRLGNSDSDYKLKFDGTNLLIGNGAITWANLDDISRANLGAITLNVTGGTRCHIFNASAVNQTNATEFTVNVLQNGGAPVGATITYAWSAGGIFNNAITSNTNKYTPVVSAYSTNESFVQVIVTINGVAYTQRIPIAIGRTGADGATGATGSTGADGYTYNLNLTGGTRSITYVASGGSPTPSTSAQFTCTLTRNGTAVTPTSYSWSCVGHVSGTGSASTFTPTIRSTWDGSITSNHVLVSVVHAGITFVAYAPIAVNKDATGLQWIDDWNSGVTVIKDKYIITPRLFAGTNSGTSSAPNITGIALGRDILAGNDNLIGIVGYKNNTPTFQLKQDGTFDFAGKMTFDGTTFNIDVGLIGTNNLIRNGRTDFATANWTTTRATLTVANYPILSRNAFRVVCTSGDTGYMQQAITGLIAGNTYTVSARCSKDSGATTARIMIYINSVYTILVTKSTNGWDIIRGTFTVPANITTATLFFGNEVVGQGSNWTDIKLEEGLQVTAWSSHETELKSTSVTITDDQFAVDTQNFNVTLRDSSNNVKLVMDATSGGLTVQGVGSDSIDRQAILQGGYMDCYYKVSGAWRHSTQYSSKGMYMYKSWASGDPTCFGIYRWDGTSEDGVVIKIFDNMDVFGIGNGSNDNVIQIRKVADASNGKLNFWEDVHVHGRKIYNLSLGIDSTRDYLNIGNNSNPAVFQIRNDIDATNGKANFWENVWFHGFQLIGLDWTNKMQCGAATSVSNAGFISTVTFPTAFPTGSTVRVSVTPRGSSSITATLEGAATTTGFTFRCSAASTVCEWIAMVQ